MAAEVGGGDWFDQQGITHPPVTISANGTTNIPPVYNGGPGGYDAYMAALKNYAPTTGATKGPTADQTPPPTGQLKSNDPAIPSYVNQNDPASLAVWKAFQAKGSTPRDQGDFQYWVDKINSTGGWSDPGNQGYWQNRMAQSQGGVGDYLERPEAGSSQSLSQMGTPSGGPPPTYAYTPYKLPTAEEVAATPGLQFTLDQQQQGLERSAAAKGGLLSGGALKDITDYRTNAAIAQGYQPAVANSLAAYNANTGQAQFGANYGLGANNQAFGQNLATNQFNLGAQNQVWNQGFQENQNAFNQYNTNQNTAFNQWLSLANLGNPGNPYA